eukprot:g5389.t1
MKLRRAALEGRDDEVAQLLEQGAGACEDNVNDRGETALHRAAEDGQAAVVKLLLDAGVDKDKADNNLGWTPLHHASGRGHPPVVQILLDAGADMDKEDDWGSTPLHWAAEHGHAAVVQILLDAGADKDKVNDHPSNAWGTPLHVAVERGHDAVAQILLDAGADKDKADAEGLTPLHLAAAKGLTAGATILLSAGADKDKLSNFGWTPAICAACSGHREMLLLFLRANACPTTPGTSVLHVAVREGHAGMVDDIVTIYPNFRRWLAFLMSTGTATARAAQLPPEHQQLFLGAIYKQVDVLRHIHSFLHKPRYMQDLNMTDVQGETALQIAQRLGR